MAVDAKTALDTLLKEAAKPAVKRTDSFATPKDKWQYVTIPEKDLYDNPFPDIQINEHTFKRGQKHFVPPDIAAEMERILKRYQDYTLHLLQPKKRQAVIDQVNKNSSGGGMVY